MGDRPAKKRARYVWVVLLLAVLVNLPLVHATWTESRIDRDGVDVPATVVDHRADGTGHWVSFTFPERIDPDQRSRRADVDRTTYDLAVGTGEIEVRVIEDDPAAYRAAGQVDSNDVLIVTVVADALLLVIALLLWRFGGRRRPQLRAIAVEDVERSASERLLERIAGETFLVRGEVTAIEEGQIVLDVGSRTVLVYLDGHHNPVGHQQPAQVRARLI